MANNSSHMTSLRCRTCRRDHFYITDAEGKPATYTGDGISLNDYPVNRLMQPCGSCARLVDVADPEYVNRLLAPQSADR